MGIQGSVELVNINKFYDKNHIVKNLNFSIQSGEFLSLLGPSGCGKSTILRMIAGLEYLDSGQIKLDGKRIDHLQPYKRPLNMIFQNYALFPHLNVYENIAYGLKAHWVPKKKIKEQVNEVIDMVQLNGFEERYPSQMSGGQRQRVSIARAIVNHPPVLLLDEPLTALDLKLRKEMRYELRNLQKKLGITFIYVTHDQEEALVMSDRIAVMNAGRIEQVGTPQEVYSKPVSQFVAEFIGETNTFEAVVTKVENKNELHLSTEAGKAIGKDNGFKKGEMVHISIRPDLLQWNINPVSGFGLSGIILENILIGSFVKSIIQLTDGNEVKIVKLAGEGLPEVGQQVYLYWDINAAVIMHSKSNKVYNIIENVDLSL